MQDSKKTVSNLRKQHNADLIKRMRCGEPLNSIDSKASWYPPRPIIKKDKGEMARVYHSSDKGGDQTSHSGADDKGSVAEFTPPRRPPLGEAS